MFCLVFHAADVPGLNKCEKIILSPFQPGRTPDMVMVKPEALVPEHLEFPRFNYKFAGLKNQFFYALGNDYLHPNRVRLQGSENHSTVVIQFHYLISLMIESV